MANLTREQLHLLDEHAPICEGVCVECGRTVTALNSVGMCEGCTMQAAIDAQERD